VLTKVPKKIFIHGFHGLKNILLKIRENQFYLRNLRAINIVASLRTSLARLRRGVFFALKKILTRVVKFLLIAPAIRWK
jgi:hypothetical protein